MRSPRATAARTRTSRPTVEALEDRCVPSGDGDGGGDAQSEAADASGDAGPTSSGDAGQNDAESGDPQKGEKQNFRHI